MSKFKIPPVCPCGDLPFSGGKATWKIVICIETENLLYPLHHHKPDKQANWSQTRIHSHSTSFCVSGMTAKSLGSLDSLKKEISFNNHKKIQQPCSTSKCVGLHRVGATKKLFFYLSCYLAALVSNWCSWMGRPRRDPRTTPLQKQPRYCECLLPLN